MMGDFDSLIRDAKCGSSTCFTPLAQLKQLTIRLQTFAASKYGAGLPSLASVGNLQWMMDVFDSLIWDAKCCYFDLFHTPSSA